MQLGVMRCTRSFWLFYLDVWDCIRRTYVRDEGHLQHAGLQPLEVNGAEDGMGFDLRGSAPLAAQPLRGIFGQKLER